MSKTQFRAKRLDAPALELSSAQREVAELSFGTVGLVVGWPGSGKTTALKELFLNLARSAKPEQILVIAASRFAATKLRDELAIAYQGATLGPLARTLSSIAFSILRQDALLEGRKLPELISGSEQDSILASILQRMISGELESPEWPKQINRTVVGLNGFRTEIRDLITVAIEHRISVSDLVSLGEKHSQPQWSAAAKVYEHYLNELELQLNAHRFDPSALLIDATDVLRAGKNISEDLKQVRQILVDDAQELTPAASEFLVALAECGQGPTGLILFGDPDVSTLGFRAANPEAMNDLAIAIAAKRTAEPIRVVIKPQHATHAVAVADAISRITPRIPVARLGIQRQGMTPSSDLVGDAADSVLRAKVFNTQQEESAWLANELRTLHLDQGVPWQDMAVVARSRDELEELERALAAESVPAHIIGAQAALRDEFGSVSFLRLLREAISDRSVSAPVAIELLSSPIAGFDALSMRRLRRALRREEISGGGSRSSDELIVALFDVAGSAATLETSDGQSPEARRADRFVKLFFAIREAAKQPETTAEDLLWLAWSGSGLAKTWPELSRGTEEVALQANRNLDSVVALFASASRFVERKPNGKALEWVDAQFELTLPEDTLSLNVAANRSVSLLTPAALIGRRFQVVALAHMQEGIWPNLRPRSSLLGAANLDALLRVGGEFATDVRSELPGELRMLYKAVGATSGQLLVSAIDTEEEQVSQFVRLLAARVPEIESFDKPQFTLRGLAGSLRRQLILSTDAAERNRIALALAQLSAEGVAGANPRDWYGISPLSTTEPLAALISDSAQATGQLVVRPSELENFIRCPLHWFIDSHGGSDSSFTARVGTLVHQALELASSSDEAELMKLVDSKWHTLNFEADWIEAAERRRAAKIVGKLAQYLSKFEADGGRVIGREVPFVYEVAGAKVSGKVDRIELYPDGRVVIADLKTSRYKVAKADVESHAQLGVYQLAYLAGAFDDAFSESTDDWHLAGARLLEVGHSTSSVEADQPSLQSNEPLREQFEQMIVETTSGMAMLSQSLVANIGLHCHDEHQFGSCKLHLTEAVSYGN